MIPGCVTLGDEEKTPFAGHSIGKILLPTSCMQVFRLGIRLVASTVTPPNPRTIVNTNIA